MYYKQSLHRKELSHFTFKVLICRLSQHIQLTSCQICGSRFGYRSCSVCSRQVCSSCVSREGMRCLKCSEIKQQRGFIRRNIPYIALFVSLWFFVSGLYPFPYFVAVGHPVDMTQFQPIFIATTILTIPFVFMLFAWKKRQSRY